MRVATLIAKKYVGDPEESLTYRCIECGDETVPAVDSDKHAVSHGAEAIRVFHGEGAYQDYLHEEKIRQAIKEM